MKAQATTLPKRQQEWLKHIRACEASGQGMKAYALSQGLNIKDLYSWKKTLVKKGALPRTRAPRFQRAQRVPVVEGHWQVQLPNGVAVSFAGGVDVGTLTTILNTAAAIE
jgi:hypothetical protein